MVERKKKPCWGALGKLLQLPAPGSATKCYQQSNNQLPGPKGRTAWAVPIITARYALAQVTIKPLSHPHLCVNKRDEVGDRKESLTSASSRGKRTWFLTNQPGEVQLTRYSAKRRARGKIFGFT